MTRSWWCCMCLGSLVAGIGPATGAPAADMVAQPPAVSFQFDPPKTLLSTADMDSNGLMFPDGPMGFVRQKGSAQYNIWASGGSFGGAGKAAHLPAGSYEFVGTLESIRPAKRRNVNAWPDRVLSEGGSQHSPDGSDFDRDYAGGGPTYLLQLKENTVAPTLLQIYHGEYHLLPRGGPAYGGSGMAVSRDGGVTFEKLGEILAPHRNRAEFFGAHSSGGLWADGAMVEADAAGHPVVGSAETVNGAGSYYYIIFTDHNSDQERYSGLSIGRVLKSDLLNAVRTHKAPVFRKYYNPNAVLTFSGDYFTEPGIGGRSTPILSAMGQYINTPGVLYDAQLGSFVLFYQCNQKQVVLRLSQNLLSWSEPYIAFQLDLSSNRRVFYPTAAGEGPDPQVLGATFQLYFLVRDRTEQGAFVNPQLMREQVSVHR